MMLSDRKFTRFPVGETVAPVSYVTTSHVREGVACDVYAFDGDDSRDLGVIYVDPGASTPRQLVVGGDRTIEGHVSGEGTLIIERADGELEEHHLDDEVQEPFAVDVRHGDTMRWQATGAVALVAFEICEPPYADGRFVDLD